MQRYSDQLRRQLENKWMHLFDRMWGNVKGRCIPTQGDFTYFTLPSHRTSFWQFRVDARWSATTMWPWNDSTASSHQLIHAKNARCGPNWMESRRAYVVHGAASVSCTSDDGDRTHHTGTLQRPRLCLGRRASLSSSPPRRTKITDIADQIPKSSNFKGL